MQNIPWSQLSLDPVLTKISVLHLVPRAGSACQKGADAESLERVWIPRKVIEGRQIGTDKVNKCMHVCVFVCM